MINIILNEKEFEHDTYDLIKAFYPDEKLVVTKDGFIDLEEMKRLNRADQEDEIHSIFIIDISDESLTIKFKKDTDEANTTEVDTEHASIGGLDRKSTHNEYKRRLYHLLERVTGRSLPWGTLTGVRPTKIVLNQLEEKVSETKIREYMEQEYLCSEDKINLSLQIAKRELELLTQMDYTNGYSVYIGIPFCPSICNYCSFASHTIHGHEKLLEDYLIALEEEMAYASTCLNHKKLTTIYIGGGTPTTLNEEQLERLLIAVDKYFDTANVFEFTVEAGRPDSITRGKLEILKKYGVTRISINPQSMVQKTLDLIGRKHSVEQIIECYEMAREVGHTNINMDIIIGLSGETKEDVAYTLKEIGKLEPDSLTVHTLAIKRAAKLNIEKEKYKDYAATDTAQMLELTMNFTKDYEYHPYYLYRQKNMSENLENIGYSKYKKEGLYNILIMEEKQTILALGAGALSKFVFHEENRIERVENVKSIRDYIARIHEMIERKRSFIDKNSRYLYPESCDSI